MSKNLILISNDEKKFEIKEQAAKRSSLLSEILSDYNYNEEREDTTIPIRGEILKRVIDYLEFYNDKEPKEIIQPLPSSNLNSFLDEWDINFLDFFSLDEYFELLNAANFLSIKSLMDLASAKIASEIYDLEPDEIREKFEIENDLEEEDLKDYNFLKI